MLDIDQLNEFEKKAALQQKNEQDPNDDKFLKPGEHICRVCKKIYPRFCSGKHGPDEGGEKSAGSVEEKQDTQDNILFDDKKSPSLEHDDFHVEMSKSNSMPGKYTFEFVKRGGSKLSEEEGKALLESVQKDFNDFVQALKEKEHETGPSGKNFNNYWSYISGNTLTCHFDAEEDAQEFISRMTNKYPEITFVRRSELDELEKNTSWKLPNPFKRELTREGA
jgi:hypothetical protein